MKEDGREALAPRPTEVSALRAEAEGACVDLPGLRVGQHGLCRHKRINEELWLSLLIIILIRGNRSPPGPSAVLNPTKTGHTREEYAVCNLIILETSPHSFLSLAQRRGNS